MINIKNITLGKIIKLVLMLAMVFIFLAPFLWVFSASVRTYAEATSLPPKWLMPPVSEWNLKYIKQLFQNSEKFLLWMRNSFVISALITVGMVFHSAIAGYAYAKLDFKGKNFMFICLLLAMMIPVQVIIVPLYRIMNMMNLTNTVWSVTLPGLVGTLCPGLSGGFGIFLLRQFYMKVPSSLEEAALIDGASPARTFFRIILPMATPTLASLAILAFSFSWNDYFNTFIMINSPSKLTLPVGILQLKQPYNTGDNVVFAAITLAIIPVLLVFIVFQKWIVKSMINIGIKG